MSNVANCCCSDLRCTKERQKRRVRLARMLPYRFARRAGQQQSYGVHSNWICQNSPPVNVVPLLGKAAAHDLQCDR